LFRPDIDAGFDIVFEAELVEILVDSPEAEDEDHGDHHEPFKQMLALLHVPS
jgi:hypothetical protein